MISRSHSLAAVVISLPLALALVACPPTTGEGEGEGDVGEGEGDVVAEGEGDVVAEGEGDVVAGEGEGEDPCPIVDLCEGVAVTGTVAFADGAVVTVNGTALTVGTTTRSAVDAALGAGVSDDNAFRVAYCAAGVLVQYVDKDGVITTTPAAAGTDAVSRVLTLSGSTATSSLSATVGQLITGAQPPATATATVGEGQIRFFGDRGLQMLLDGDGRVAQLAAFKPQSRDIWTLGLTLASNDQALSTLRRDDTFADAAAILGADFDATGVIDAGGLIGDVQVRIWSSAGVRIVGRCGSNACGENTPISSITLSPPFVGRDATVGIGSTRAELEADVGTGSADGDVIVYGEPDALGFGDPALGVVYVQDSQCVERAAAFVFNYFNPN